MMGRMGKRVWVVAVVLLSAVVLHLWWQNGRLVRRRAQALAALEEQEAKQVRATQAAHEAATRAKGPRNPDDVKAAVAAVLPASGDPDEGEPPPPERHWAVEFFTPHAGENLIAYRDRVLPVVQAVAAPQRKRVRRWRDEFQKDAQLSDAQQRELDAAVGDAGEHIKDRIFQGILAGELGPRTKASTGVAFARDLLDIADGANKRFRASLSPSQSSLLDGSRFDVVDYLFFSTRWEDMLGVEEP